MNIQKSSTQIAQPALCNSCHSFYGTQSTNWLCSSCFKKQTNKPHDEGIKSQIKIKQIELQSQIVKQKQQVKCETIQQNKNKCFSCQKKLGLLGTQCKCKFVFCNAHRLPENHQCQFDHKTAGQKKLQMAAVKVNNQKIEKI